MNFIMLPVLQYSREQTTRMVQGRTVDTGDEQQQIAITATVE